MKNLKFEELPEEMQKVSTQLDRVEALLNRYEILNKPTEVQYFDLNSLIEYLPDHPALQTVYGKIHRREIPFGKQHGRLYFIKEDIDKWLTEGRNKTKYEISEEVKTSIGRRVR